MSLRAKLLLQSLLLAALLLPTGCTRYSKQIPTGNPLRVSNVYSNPTYPHKRMTSVALLPVANPLDNNLLYHYSEALAVSTLRNFGKFNYFNLTYLRHLSPGEVNSVNTSTEAIDRVVLGELGQANNVKGIMKLSVTDFNPFPPMRMKVSAVLFDASTGERVWAVDQTFDTDDADVYNAMRMWWNDRMAGGDPFTRFESKVLDPNFFFNYVLNQVADSYGEARVENLRVIQQTAEGLN